MDFPYEYFKAEIRNGTLISETTKKAWAASVETLEEVVKAIEAKNLRYCAVYGTLLGAVRHKGFIPWDDDIDIAMPRSDYDIFRKSCFDVLPEGYNVLDPCVEEVRGLDMLRICNSASLCDDPEFLRKYHGCPYIIGIDIYPIDNVPDDEEMDAGICDALKLIARVITIDMDIETATEDDILERSEILDVLENNLHRKFPEDDMIHINLMQEYDRLSSAFKGKKTRNVTIYRNHRFSKKHIFPRGIFTDCIETSFEGMTIKIPRDYDAVLKTMFGNYIVPKQWTGVAHEYGFEQMQRIVFEELGYLM